MFNIISNTDKERILSNINDNKRSHTRGFEEFRNIDITKLDTNGQIQTKIGNTLIISQIFSKLISPNKERPSEGVIVFSVKIV